MPRKGHLPLKDMDDMSIKLYEFECVNEECDVILQIQTKQDISGSIGCMCGHVMNKVFSTEIDDTVFGGSNDIIIPELEETNDNI